MSEGQIAALLGVLSLSGGETGNCPLAAFARDVRSALVAKGGDDANLGDILAERSVELLREEEKINSTTDMITLTHDKLRAEITRVEAQKREQERRLKEVTQQRKLCKAALNLIVSGGVPNLVDADQAGAATFEPPVRAMKHGADSTKEDDGEQQPSNAAPETAPMKTVRPTTTRGASSSGNGETSSHKTTTTTQEGRPGADAASAAAAAAAAATAKPSTAARNTGATSGAAAPSGPPASPRGASSAVTGTGLVAMLRMPDVKETALLSAIDSYEQQTFGKGSTRWMATETHLDVLTVLMAVLKHLPQPRPPVQLAELRLLGYVLQAAPTNNAVHNKNAMAMLEALVNKGEAVPILAKLLNSVNDDVKCEVLECLSPVVCGSNSLVASMTAGANPSAPNVCTAARREFLKCNGLEPLVNIVVYSTSEPVLERALVFLWGLLSKDEKVDIENNGGRSIRAEVRGLGGLRAVLDLLYTDSLAILENVCMVIGYITREDSSKKEIREIGGLEKITATLRHPSDSIKTKMAGAVWNCASNAENRAYLRQLGAIPALLELLKPSASSPSSGSDGGVNEFVRENAAGALWNLSVDTENKTQILDYGGIPVLIHVMSSSNSSAVVENVSGTLWNCSAVVETRPVIRKAGGIPILLSLLGDRKSGGGATGAGRTTAVTSSMPLSEKILDNVAGTLRNCAINDQNKPLIREAGGVELILQRLKDALLEKPASRAAGGAAAPSGASVPLSNNTMDKLASTLWILTISPEIKHTVRMAGGIATLTKILELSSPVIAGAAAKGNKTGSLFQGVNISPSVSRRYSSPADYYQGYFSPAVLAKLPSATPSVSVGMSIKEKIAGVLRNCSTVPENRPVMVECGAVRCLVSVVLDCYCARTVFPPNTASHRNGSRPQEPSVQLKETISSALWYLSRDDKVTPRLQGGLELMCMFMVTPQQPNVVLEQAAGALSSLTVNNPENRDALRHSGGLHALVHLTTSKAESEYPPRKADAAARNGGKASGDNPPQSNTFAVLNALLTVRNSTINNDENLRYCADAAVQSGKGGFGQALLYVVQHGSEDAAREAALTLKNLCAVAKVVEFAEKNNGTAVLNGLAERATTDTVRRAAASALQALARTAKK